MLKNVENIEWSGYEEKLWDTDGWKRKGYTCYGIRVLKYVGNQAGVQDVKMWEGEIRMCRVIENIESLID